MTHGRRDPTSAASSVVLSAVGALAAGGAASLPFFPHPLAAWLLPWALIPLIRVVAAGVRDQGSIWRFWRDGALIGLGFNLGVYHWIPKLDPINLTMPWIMFPTLFLMAGYLALWTLGAVISTGLICRGRVDRIVWVLPAAWAGWEWFRGIGPMGFSWGALGHALAPAPITYQIADGVGVFGVTFALVWVATRLALPSRRHLVEAAIGIALVLGYGAVRLAEDPPPGPTLRAALIQPNLSPAEKWERGNADGVFSQYLRQSRQAAAGGADVIIWPETATPFRLLASPSHRSRVHELAIETGAVIVTGTPHVDLVSEADSTIAVHRNAAVAMSLSGDVQIYRKQWLVPFSEWIPWTWLRLMEVNFGQADFRPGTSADPLVVGDHKLGMLICIEVIFPRFSRRAVLAGADVLVNVTNDAWFGESAAPFQHAATARLRAVETRRPVIRCANTGISSMIDRYGHVIDSRPLGERSEITGLITPETSTTMYVRVGDWAVAVLGLLSLLAAFLPRPIQPNES